MRYLLFLFLFMAVLLQLFCHSIDGLPTSEVNELQLTVVHFNDFHARFDEQSPTSGVCKPSSVDQCHGGFARMYESIMDLFHNRNNPILLNAGDNFQGSLWYTLFRWNVTQYFMNMLPIKAHTIGNHEFDDGVAGVVPFLKAMKAPALVCNMNASQEPEMQGLYKKSMTFEVDGKKLGIVGGDLIFLDDVKSVNAEVDRLVQEENVFSVIVLSHAGYDRDLRMAAESTKKISLIVGGHTHSFLNNDTGEDGSKPAGPYPTVVPRKVDGQPVLVVQASAYTRYLGNLQVTFDANGVAKSWSGGPIYLAPHLPKNEEILKLLQPWKDVVDSVGEKVFGSTAVYLDQKTCYYMECNLGNLITDAMVFSYKSKAIGNSWTFASLAVMNVGGIRSSIPIGNITYNDLITTQPFNETFDVGLLQGKYIKAFLERTATPYRFRSGYGNVNLLQLSGFRVIYKLSNPKGERVVDVKVACADCPKPEYEDLDLDKDYKIIVPSFIGVGGDGFQVISENIKNYTVGEHDMDVFERYLPIVSPIQIGLEGRMTFIGRQQPKMVKMEFNKYF